MTTATIKVGTESVDAFFERSLERSGKLDRGEKLQPEFSVTFENPAELARLLSWERVQVIRAVLEKPAPVSELATRLGRDRKAIRRDVSLLKSSGLVKTHSEPNPGHGRRTIVEPVAAKYQLIATI